MLPFVADPNAVFTQPDGKILVAGTADEDFAVWRFNHDGSLDRSFGGGDGATAVGFGGRDELRAAASSPTARSSWPAPSTCRRARPSPG